MMISGFELGLGFAQMDYVKSHTHPPDGKIFGLGHSMGGIILYAMLGTRGKNTLQIFRVLVLSVGVVHCFLVVV